MARHFCLSFEKDWFQSVICSNEKWFVKHRAPSKQTNIYWAPAHPHNVIGCKKAYLEKVMAMVGMAIRITLPVELFETSVTLDQLISLKRPLHLTWNRGCEKNGGKCQEIIWNCRDQQVDILNIYWSIF